MKDLTITIVSYHNEADVVNAVSSIEQHTPASVSKQIFIVDNVDTQLAVDAVENAAAERIADDANVTAKSLKALEQQYEDVTYLATGKNLGFGGGHNFVLERLDSKYHAIVNPDILLTEDSFSKLISFMEQEKVGMCVPKLVDEKGNLLGVYRRELTVWDMFLRMFLKGAFKKRQAYHTMQDADYTKSFDIPFAQGSFLLIQTELYKKLGGFDERFFLYMEDADLCKRVNEVSNLRFCPDTAVIHKWEKGSHKSGKLFRLHVQSMLTYFNKWGWKLI